MDDDTAQKKMVVESVDNIFKNMKEPTLADFAQASAAQADPILESAKALLDSMNQSSMTLARYLKPVPSPMKKNTTPATHVENKNRWYQGPVNRYSKMIKPNRYGQNSNTHARWSHNAPSKSQSSEVNMKTTIAANEITLSLEPVVTHSQKYTHHLPYYAKSISDSLSAKPTDSSLMHKNIDQRIPNSVKILQEWHKKHIERIFKAGIRHVASTKSKLSTSNVRQVNSQSCLSNSSIGSQPKYQVKPLVAQKRKYHEISNRYYQYLNEPKRARHSAYQVIYRSRILIDIPEPVESSNTIYPKNFVTWPSGKIIMPGYCPNRPHKKYNRNKGLMKKRTCSNYRVPKPKVLKPVMVNRSSHINKKKDFRNKLYTGEKLKWDPVTKKFSYSAIPNKIANMANCKQWFRFPSATALKNTVPQNNVASRSNLAVSSIKRKYSVGMSKMLPNKPPLFRPDQVKTFVATSRSQHSIRDIHVILGCNAIPEPCFFNQYKYYADACIIFQIRRFMAARVRGRGDLEETQHSTKIDDEQEKTVGRDKFFSAPKVVASTVYITTQTEAQFSTWSTKLSSVMIHKDLLSKKFTPHWLHVCPNGYVEDPPVQILNMNQDVPENVSRAWSLDESLTSAPVRIVHPVKHLLPSQGVNGQLPQEFSIVDTSECNKSDDRCVLPSQSKVQASQCQTKTIDCKKPIMKRKSRSLPQPSYCVRYRMGFCNRDCACYTCTSPYQSYHYYSSSSEHSLGKCAPDDVKETVLVEGKLGTKNKNYVICPSAHRTSSNSGESRGCGGQNFGPASTKDTLPRDSVNCEDALAVNGHEATWPRPNYSLERSVESKHAVEGTFQARCGDKLVNTAKSVTAERKDIHTASASGDGDMHSAEVVECSEASKNDKNHNSDVRHCSDVIGQECLKSRPVKKDTDSNSLVNNDGSDIHSCNDAASGHVGMGIRVVKDTPLGGFQSIIQVTTTQKNTGVFSDQLVLGNGDFREKDSVAFSDWKAIGETYGTFEYSHVESAVGTPEWRVVDSVSDDSNKDINDLAALEDNAKDRDDTLQGRSGTCLRSYANTPGADKIGDELVSPNAAKRLTANVSTNGLVPSSNDRKRPFEPCHEFKIKEEVSSNPVSGDEKSLEGAKRSIRSSALSDRKSYKDTLKKDLPSKLSKSVKAKKVILDTAENSGLCKRQSATPAETRSSRRLRSRGSVCKRSRYEADYISDFPKSVKKPKKVLPTNEYDNESFWQFYQRCENTVYSKNLLLQHKYLKILKDKGITSFHADSTVMRFSNVACATTNAPTDQESPVVPESGIMPFLEKYTRIRKAPANDVKSSDDHCGYCGRSFSGQDKKVFEQHLARHGKRYTILSAPRLPKKKKKGKPLKKENGVSKRPSNGNHIPSTSLNNAPAISSSKDSCMENARLDNLKPLPRPSLLSMGHRKQTARKSFSLASTLPKDMLIAALECEMRAKSNMRTENNALGLKTALPKHVYARSPRKTTDVGVNGLLPPPNSARKTLTGLPITYGHLREAFL